MRISVVIPTYNSSERLRTTIRSVLDQSIQPVDLIVIDDGSTDDTRQVCRSFGDDIRYYKVANGGQQAARNFGVEVATGDWIAFLDHDDLWQIGYLAELEAFYRNHIGFDLIFCNSRSNGEDGQRSISNRFTEFAPKGYWEALNANPGNRWDFLRHYDLSKFLRFHPVQPSVMTIRKSLYKKLGGFNPKMRGSSVEDFEFSLRAIRSSRGIGLLWKPLVTITRHAQNASVDGSKSAIDLVDCLLYALENHDMDAHEKRMVETELQRRLPNAIDGAFTLRQFTTVRRHHDAIGSSNSKLRFKYAISLLPKPLAQMCADRLTR